jgi:hypothetical protein
MLLKTKQLSQFFRFLTCSVDVNDATCKSFFLFFIFKVIKPSTKRHSRKKPRKPKPFNTKLEVVLILDFSYLFLIGI